ncbi:hypothetical protein MPLSOD_320001 [Mesorhizobium sp. SOD10]|nr:hypothetical protein MPLSOD_320001 [Mesorhizobium sp. SOD10]
MMPRPAGAKCGESGGLLQEFGESIAWKLETYAGVGEAELAIAYVGDWPERPSHRHSMAEQGAKRPAQTIESMPLR